MGFRVMYLYTYTKGEMTKETGEKRVKGIVKVAQCSERISITRQDCDDDDDNDEQRVTTDSTKS